MATNRIYAGTPEEWKNTPLRELCLKTEIDDPTKSPHRTFRYVDVSSVSNQLWKITSSTEHTGSTAPSRARKVVKANDVIFATVRPTLKRIALVPDYLDGQIVSTAFCVLRPDATLADSRFIYYSLLTDGFVERVGNLQRGASYPAVADGDVLDQEILLPPVSEQQAIAEVLSKIQAAIEVQDGIVATLKELKAATMAKLFREGLRGEPLKQTEIGEIPESWEVVDLRELCVGADGFIQTGPFGSQLHASDYIADGIPIVNPTHIGEGRIRHEGIPKISKADADRLQRHKLRVGDILFSRRGDVGRHANVFEGEEGWFCGTGCLIVRASEKRIQPLYLHYFLSTPFAQEYLASHAVGSIMPNINTKVLAQVPVGLAPYEEQGKIAEILRRIDEKIAHAAARRDALKSLFSSMLHVLMTGRVRVTPKMIALQRAADWAARRAKWSGKVDEKVLEQVVKRIVEAVAPEKIILFGSAARGEMGPDSDLDLLIVKSDVHRLATAQMIEHSLTGITISTDIVVATPKDIEMHKDTIGLIYRPALQEGKILYAA